MKASITFAHYNRPDFLRRTLHAYYVLHQNILDDIEFIVIDDNSTDSAEEVCAEFSSKLNISYNYIKNEKKNVNPVRLINMGVQLAQGEVIFIANPECLPINSIVTDAISRLHEDVYLSYLCYSLSNETQNIVNQIPLSANYIDDIMKQTGNLPNRSVSIEGEDGWYNHPVFRPVGYHFTAALRRDTFIEIGGFDESFKDGLGYDDNDFLRRLGVKQIPLLFGEGIVLHQNHYSNTWMVSDQPSAPSNADLYFKMAEAGNWKAAQSIFYEEA